MEKFCNLDKTDRQTCVSLGYFDGVHVGHQAVILQASKVARSENLLNVVFTFDVPPKEAITGGLVPRIVADDEKERIFSGLGVDVLYSVPFFAVMNMSADEFVKKVLVKTLNAKHVFCGFNYIFGKNREGTRQKMADLCEKYGLCLHVAEPVTCGGRAVSSTRVRELISAGDMESVSKMLGRNFSYSFFVYAVECAEKPSNGTDFYQRIPRGFVAPRQGIYESKVEIGPRVLSGTTTIRAGNGAECTGVVSKTFVSGHCDKKSQNQNVKVMLRKLLLNTETRRREDEKI